MKGEVTAGAARNKGKEWKADVVFPSQICH